MKFTEREFSSFNEYTSSFYWPLFSREVQVVIDSLEHEDYAKESVGYVLNLSEEVLKTLCYASIDYCNDFLKEVGEKKKEFKNYKDILKLIQPTLLCMPIERHEGIKVFNFEMECEWEVEHGLQWLVKNDQVLYVGSFEGYSPFCEIENDEYNYAIPQELKSVKPPVCPDCNAILEANETEKVIYLICNECGYCKEKRKS